jgi:hypothetical protein
MDKKLEQLLDDMGNIDLPENEKFIDKLDKNCSLDIGKRLYWYYKEDLEYYQDINENPRDFLSELYSGICIPRYGIERTRDLEIEDTVIIIDDYPTEMDPVEIDWVALGRLLNNESLIEVFGEE